MTAKFKLIVKNYGGKYHELFADERADATAAALVESGFETVQVCDIDEGRSHTWAADECGHAVNLGDDDYR